MRRKLALVAEAEPTTLAAKVEEYLVDVDARTRNPRTRAFYEQGLLKVLLPFAEEHGLREPGELTTDLMNRLVVDLQGRTGRHGRPLAAATIAAYMRAVRQFVTWLRKREEASDVEVARPREPRQEIDVLTPDEVQAMVAAATSARDQTLLQLLWETGCRLQEALSLTADDLVDEGRKGRFVRIRHRARAGGAKGDSARLVPIRPALYAALRRLTARRVDTLTNLLFVTDRRRGGEHMPLSPRQAQQAVQVAAAQAGIPKRVYPHLLRHSMATHWMAKRKDPVTLQRILGHSDLTMIARIYSHPSSGDLYEAMMDYLRES